MQKEKPPVENLLENTQELMKLIDRLLSSILSETNSMGKGNSKFHCKIPPAISIADYLKRISKYSHCSNSVYILSLIYIDRLQQRLEGFILNSYSIHRRLLISTIMLSAKFIDDFYFKNVYYAKIGGIQLLQINSMEQQILKVFNYDLNVSQAQFNTYLEKLRNFQQINSI